MIRRYYANATVKWIDRLHPMDPMRLDLTTNKLLFRRNDVCSSLCIGSESQEHKQGFREASSFGQQAQRLAHRRLAVCI